MLKYYCRLLGMFSPHLGLECFSLILYNIVSNFIIRLTYSISKQITHPCPQKKTRNSKLDAFKLWHSFAVLSSVTSRFRNILPVKMTQTTKSIEILLQNVHNPSSRSAHQNVHLFFSSYECKQQKIDCHSFLAHFCAPKCSFIRKHTDFSFSVMPSALAEICAPKATYDLPHHHHHPFLLSSATLPSKLIRKAGGSIFNSSSFRC